MGKFKVKIQRIEVYTHSVAIEAKDEEDAERIVREMDKLNAFENQWNELDPSVKTDYCATEAE